LSLFIVSFCEKIIEIKRYIINSYECFITNLLTGPHIAADELKEGVHSKAMLRISTTSRTGGAD
jgi:hypothetical protein